MNPEHDQKMGTPYSYVVPKHKDALLVIDTEAIKEKHPRQNDDEHSRNNPKLVSNDYIYMITTEGDNIFQPVFQQALSAKESVLFSGININDILILRSTSIGQNSEDAVLIYDVLSYYYIGPWDLPVFDRFSVMLTEYQEAVMPSTFIDPHYVNVPNHDGLPPMKTKITYNAFGAKILHPGRDYLKISFALYELDAIGTSQIIYGYFYTEFYVDIKA